MAHIVIVGAGLGGLPMAFEMKEQMRPSDRLTVVSNTPHFHFVPSNPWVAVGWRRQAEIELALAPLLARRGIEFTEAGAARVHAAENRLELGDGSTLDYDFLILATGPDLAFDEIEGLGPHDGFTQSVCHVDHAVRAERAWRDFVREPGPVIVGAVQGASCFGPAYEFARIMDTDLRRRKIRDRVPITFVTSEPYIGHMGLDGVGDSKGLMESEFRSHDIKWITSARVTKVAAKTMTIERVDAEGAVSGQEELPFSFSMMLPAFRGIRAISGIEGLVNPRGFVIVDKHQRNPAFPNIFAVGVCVAIAPVGKTPVPVGVPKTGYMIESMVTATAHNIGRLLRGEDPESEATWHAICLADFGDKGLAFAAAPQLAPRNLNWASGGRWVHWAKIAFEKYFLFKLKYGLSEPFWERHILSALGIRRLRNRPGKAA